MRGRNQRITVPKPGEAHREDEIVCISLFFRTLLVAIGTLWGFVRQSSRSDEIAELNRELAKKSDEIARLSQENLATVTGGDSFARIAFNNRQDKEGALFVVEHSGKYPLYEITIRVADLGKWKGIPPGPLKLEVLSEIDRVFSVGTLPVGISFILGRFPLGDGPRRFNMFFTGRNGSWTQLIRLHPIRGDWEMATRVLRGDMRDPKTVTILFEHIDNTFPRNTAGEVDWQ